MEPTKIIQKQHVYHESRETGRDRGRERGKEKNWIETATEGVQMELRSEFSIVEKELDCDG